MIMTLKYYESGATLATGNINFNVMFREIHNRKHGQACRIEY